MKLALNRPVLSWRSAGRGGTPRPLRLGKDLPDIAAGALSRGESERQGTVGVATVNDSFDEGYVMYV